MPIAATLRGRRGGSLILMVLLVSFAITAMAMGAIGLASGAQLSTRFSAREASLQAAANGGLELIRDSLNRGNFDSLLPLNSFTTLASNATITDAYGSALPGITRSLYVGRTGGRTGGQATAGQYGSNFASAISIIRDLRGAVAARRLLMTQESWAKFAVAINNWSGSAMYGCGESVSGPFFSNSGLIIQSGCGSGSGTLFSSSVNIVAASITGGPGRYTLGYKTGVTPIPWPTPARINLMRQYAQDADAANGDYDITSATNGSRIPATRIEFLTIDVNHNGIIEWDEGFLRVWKAANTSDSALAYATARRWPTAFGGGAASGNDPNMISRNCGAVTQLNNAGASIFRTASDIYSGTSTNKTTAVQTALTSGQRHCYLGGDPHIYSAVTFDSLTPDSLTTNTPVASNNFGWWVKRRSGALASLTTVRSGDASRLIPLGANPNFKGVIFVTGDVAISGRLRGRVSVVATGNIIMADDLNYTNPPGTKCDAEGDIFGAIATKDVIIENNNLQTPFPVNGVWWAGFDDTNDANYNMFLLAAGSGGTTDGNWYGEGVMPPWTPPVSIPWSGGSVNASAIAAHCGDAPNGCVRVTGGLAQGRVDNATYYPQTFGWGEAHTYDPCGAVNPPPYFPTTGRFVESRYYELDPVWLNQITITEFFNRLRAQ